MSKNKHWDRMIRIYQKGYASHYDHSIAEWFEAKELYYKDPAFRVYYIEKTKF